MDSILTSPNLGFLLLGTSILATAFWYFLRWYDEFNVKAFKERNLKYVNMGNLFLDVILKRRIEVKKDAFIKREGKVFGKFFLFTESRIFWILILYFSRLQHDRQANDLSGGTGADPDGGQQGVHQLHQPTRSPNV